MSVLRSVKKRKKNRKLGKIEIIRREEYAGLEVDTKVELIRLSRHAPESQARGLVNSPLPKE